EGPSYSSPMLMDVGGVRQVVVMTEASVVGLALDDGRLLWQLPFQAGRMAYNASTPIVDGQTVIYAGSGRGTKAVRIERKADGFGATELWSCDTAPQFCSAVLKDGMLFGLSDKGNIYCIDAKTGTLAWLDGTNRRNFGAMLDVGPCLVLLPEGGELLVFKPSRTGYEEVAKYKVSENATYAHPVLSGNRLYIKDRDSLALWTL
ncbi:MAG: PQQ-binding-like beta-propeller repeat protein, partial [Sedimentisphaerales bacterium]|nr:PQQ-binding-like beta-propeller repeat protein [Sedimentisphaerales bacterium]